MQQKTLAPATRIAGAAVAIVGLAVLAGWFFDLVSLKSMIPHGPTMKANTALGFVLIGSSLWLLGRPNKGARAALVGQLFALFSVLLGLASVSQDLFGWNLGIDQLLFEDTPGSNVQGAPGRMSPSAAFSFLTMGSAFVLLHAGVRWQRVVQWLVGLPTVIALLTVITYTYGLTTIYPRFTQMALHTAVTFLVASFGFLCALPVAGFSTVLFSEGPGSRMARRFLPAVILVPAALGLLRLKAEQAGMFGTEVGVALFATVSIVLLVALIWWEANSLNQADVERRRAVEDLDRFFNLSIGVFCTAGFDGYFKRVNPSFEATLGWSRAELLAAPFMEFRKS